MAPAVPPHVRGLVAVCIMMWGVYCVYGMPGTLSKPLQAHLSLTDSQYTYFLSAMYTVFAAPNTVLPFFSGFMIQRYGEKRAMKVTVGCVALGQLTFALGVELRQIWIIMLGRVVFGLGMEVLGVLANIIAARLFSDKKLTLALSLVLGVARMGSVSNSIMTPLLVARNGVASATWTMSLFAMSLTCLCSAYLLPGLPAPANNASRSFDIASIWRFSPVYWQLILICAVGYGGIGTFTNSAQRFLAARFFNNDQPAAGRALSITYTLAAVLVPPFGIVLEMPWFRIPFALLISNVLMTSAHLAFYIRSAGAILPLAMLGTAYALYGTAFWAGLARSILDAGPSQPAQRSESRVGLLESQEHDILSNETLSESHGSMLLDTSSDGQPDNLMAVGLGTATCFLNLSTALVPLLLAGVEQRFGYSGLEVVFITLAGCGCLASIKLAHMHRFAHTETKRP
ncbi:MFS general substrate transporter [Dothidotthia symphoricarpi CBS 119687]|uniref:Lysosomal dipeptide transporter MFSD1 n=1 Tax=Dothidotthia symphoricarpi CBS 119687 TaxID=1392245 RepID=A0A6A6AIB7_9PLEO|nr:MFS general substrate transporter [Dothidotthia symphoricarpi CBS 119687]KAF2130171.1 MFS general substrate transporter [Dothidotthia symphoricarpi CBS 119687]